MCEKQTTDYRPQTALSIPEIGHTEYGRSENLNLILLAFKDPLKSFKIIAFLLLGKFWLNLAFTPKYTTVEVEEGVFEFLKQKKSKPYFHRKHYPTVNGRQP